MHNHREYGKIKTNRFHKISLKGEMKNWKQTKEFCMKNKIGKLGIIIFVMVIGVVMSSCDLFEDDKYSFEGTWRQGSSQIFTFTGNEFYYNRTLISGIRGTFTNNKTHIQFNTTHTRSGNNWVELSSGSTGGAGNTFDGRDVPYEFSTNNSGNVILDITLGGIWGGKFTKE